MRQIVRRGKADLYRAWVVMKKADGFILRPATIRTVSKAMKFIETLRCMNGSIDEFES
jgi:hypothetical protein